MCVTDCTHSPFICKITLLDIPGFLPPLTHPFLACVSYWHSNQPVRKGAHALTPSLISPPEHLTPEGGENVQSGPRMSDRMSYIPALGSAAWCWVPAGKIEVRCTTPSSEICSSVTGTFQTKHNIYF